MAHFYVLRSLKTGRFYVGATSRLRERLDEYNRRQAKSTRSGVPWEVVYTEVAETIQEAKAREQQVKSWKSAVAIRELIEGR